MGQLLHRLLALDRTVLELSVRSNIVSGAPRLVEVLGRQPDIVEPSDQQLFKRARSGDHASFVILIGRHVPKLLAAANAILNNHADAEDCVQEATIIAFKKLRSVKDPNKFPAWYLRVAVNKARDLRRARKETATLLEVEELHYSIDESQEDYLDLQAAIAQMPEPYKQVVTLHLSGLNSREIGDALDRPSGTIRRWLVEVNARLKSVLEPYG